MNQEVNLKVDVLGLEGSNYQVGKQQGKRMEIGDAFHVQKEMTQHANAIEAKALLATTAPNLLQELQGLADGLDIPRDTIIKMYSGYDVAFPEMGCTALAQDTFYIRNYDFSPELYDARLIFSNSENGYASVGFSQQIIGRLDGMNEKGLVIGLHLVNETIGEKGFLGTTIVRMVLDQCSTVREAVDFIQTIPHGFCFNYSLMDKDGATVKIEASPSEQVIHYPEPLICTNHFEAGTLKVNNRLEITGSTERKHYLETLSKKELTQVEAYHCFNDEDGVLFFTNYKEYFGTLHTVVYSPTDLQVMVGIGGNCEPYLFSFGDWLNGDIELPLTVTGKITV